MRLYLLYMMRDGEKLPIGCIPCEPSEIASLELPDPPDGVDYLAPEEVQDPGPYERAVRKYSALAESSFGPDRDQILRTLAGLQSHLDELRSQRAEPVNCRGRWKFLRVILPMPWLGRANMNIDSDRGNVDSMA